MKRERKGMKAKRLRGSGKKVREGRELEGSKGKYGVKGCIRKEE